MKSPQEENIKTVVSNYTAKLEWGRGKWSLRVKLYLQIGVKAVSIGEKIRNCHLIRQEKVRLHEL